MAVAEPVRDGLRASPDLPGPPGRLAGRGAWPSAGPRCAASAGSSPGPWRSSGRRSASARAWRPRRSSTSRTPTFCAPSTGSTSPRSASRPASRSGAARGRRTRSASTRSRGVAVVPRLAEGRKCARSWKITPDVGSDPEYPDVTPRDAAALAGMGRRAGGGVIRPALRRGPGRVPDAGGAATPRLSAPARLGFLAAAAALLLDQATKLFGLFVLDLPLTEPIRLAPFLDLVAHWNRGISYGLFQQSTEAGRWLLVAISAARLRRARGLDRAGGRPASRRLARPHPRRGRRQRRRPARLRRGVRLRPFPRRRLVLVRVQRGRRGHRRGRGRPDLRLAGARPTRAAGVGLSVWPRSHRGRAPLPTGAPSPQESRERAALRRASDVDAKLGCCDEGNAGRDRERWWPAGFVAAAGARAEEGVLMKSILGTIGIIPEDRPAIDYRERAPLVLPPRMDLREPARAEGGSGPQRPVADRSRSGGEEARGGRGPRARQREPGAPHERPRAPLAGGDAGAAAAGRAPTASRSRRGARTGTASGFAPMSCAPRGGAAATTRRRSPTASRPAPASRSRPRACASPRPARPSRPIRSRWCGRTRPIRAPSSVSRRGAEASAVPASTRPRRRLPRGLPSSRAAHRLSAPADARRASARSSGR